MIRLSLLAWLPLVAPFLTILCLIIGIIVFYSILKRQQTKNQSLLLQLAEHNQQQLAKLREFTLESQQRQQQFFADRQEHASSRLRQEIGENLERQSAQFHRSMQSLTQQTHQHLQQMGEKVDQRLEKGLVNTQETFKDIIIRLSKIDEAQKRIDQLANDMHNLSDILNDKRSRGAFGESQLQTLVDNILPAQHISYQHYLKNGKRPDCLIHLPQPTGNLCIDAKFPLESYRHLIEAKTTNEQIAARRQFHQDVKKHLNDIASKYISPPETAVGAIMFIPAEAVFAEIHANHIELVELSYRLNVWMTSPTTLAAILTSARAVIRDDATRKQAHILREHLYGLHQDFAAFQSRMDQLAKHINLAQKEVSDAHKNASQISIRFQALENMDTPPPKS